MYLSRVELDVHKRDTMRALASPSMLHGAIERSFLEEWSSSDGRKRNLWRLDQLHGKQYLLLLSEKQPELANLEKQFGVAESCETKDYTNLLERVGVGTRWRFRLAANPTVSHLNREGTEKDRGKVTALAGVSSQRTWLLERAETNGFRLDEAEFDVSQSQWYTFYKNDKQSRRQVRLLGVVYDGVLEVADADRFRYALTHGIGREKAYGMGLLTVMRE